MAGPAVSITPGEGHWFFGYYDKSPWDATGRYVLALRVGFMDRPPGPEDRAELGLIDTADRCSWRVLAETTAWNWQQGCMLQWLPSEPDRRIVFNARRGDEFRAVVMDVQTGERRELPLPVYALAPDGATAYSLNFSRLADCRPGYGYAGLPDPFREEARPARDGVWRMDLRTGETKLVLSIEQVAMLRPRPSMGGAKHWFNHVQVSPDGSRFAFLHRWRRFGTDSSWRTQLVTASADGTGALCLSDGDMVSHYDWRDPGHILAWARRPGIGDRFFLIADRSREWEVVGDGVLSCDGHCSYSPDRRRILTDTYPAGPRRERTLLVYEPASKRRIVLGAFADGGLEGEIRCDLHPRWSRDGRKVCFDSVHEGPRRMYVMDVPD